MVRDITQWKRTEAELRDAKEAAEAGLATTLFDRLKDILPANLQALLRVQYRMHESIMRFSSDEFYQGDLIIFPSAYHERSDLGVESSLDLLIGLLRNGRSLEGEVESRTHACP